MTKRDSMQCQIPFLFMVTTLPYLNKKILDILDYFHFI